MKDLMKDLAHTYGPWHTLREVFNPMKHGHSPETYRAIGIGNGACHVGYASVSGCVGAIEADANARLMAAAPELLAALQNCLCYLESDSDDEQERADWQQAQNAINKAIA